jgi:MSHA pilin protein MshD
MPEARKIFKHAGFTLLEIITTVVVIAIAATALMSVFSSTVATSADPVLEHQAIAIAEAYMDEIAAKEFGPCPVSAPCPGSERLAPAPADIDDVLDYNSLPDTIVRDQNGVAIAALSDYSITVKVETKNLNGIADALFIEITVSHASIDPVLLNGYRTNY